PEDASRSARRRLEHAAAVAAAGRRAEAEAWLARVEASVDAARAPLTELDRSPPAQVSAPPTRAVSPAPPEGTPDGHLDLADAPAGRRHDPEDMSDETSSERPQAIDMSPAASASGTPARLSSGTPDAASSPSGTDSRLSP